MASINLESMYWITSHLESQLMILDGSLSLFTLIIADCVSLAANCGQRKNPIHLFGQDLRPDWEAEEALSEDCSTMEVENIS